MGYALLAATILLSVLGQVIFKWQIDLVSGFPDGLRERTLMLVLLVLKPWMVVAYTSAFLASLTWLGTLRYFELSYAYPFMSLTLIGVLIAGYFLFGEIMGVTRIAGTVMVMAGLVILSR